MAGTEARAFFAAEIERLMDRLYGAALRLTRNRCDAEDLVSETVVKAWAAFGQLEDRACFEKWIHRILANTFFSRCRHKREFTADTSPDDENDDGGFSLFDRLHQPFLLWWGNPELELVNTLLREDLDAALEALPDGYRDVVILVDLLGHAYAEAGETLGIPVGTVRSRLNRARTLLQRTLWEHAVSRGLAPETPASGPPT